MISSLFNWLRIVLWPSKWSILEKVLCILAAAKSLQPCLTLCDPIDRSPPGSPIPGILQARTLEWGHFLLQCKKLKSESEVAQLCPTRSDPVDYSLPGSSVHGIFQARVLEWVAIAFSTVYTWEDVYLLLLMTEVPSLTRFYSICSKISRPWLGICPCQVCITYLSQQSF